MKRISLLTIIVLTLLPTVSRAYYYGSVSLRYPTRYSPHPFGYKYPSGLILRDLCYSLYAFSYHHFGLIPDWVRCSPYAFSHKYPSGLVSDYWSRPYYFDRSRLLRIDNRMLSANFMLRNKAEAQENPAFARTDTCINKVLRLIYVFVLFFAALLTSLNYLGWLEPVKGFICRIVKWFLSEKFFLRR